MADFMGQASYNGVPKGEDISIRCARYQRALEFICARPPYPVALKRADEALYPKPEGKDE